MDEVIEAIKRYSKFLITAHVNLEGDSIGSQLAMKELLGYLGKAGHIVDDDPVPKHYKFMPKVNDISVRTEDAPDFEAAIVLDCPTLKRIGRVRELISKDKVIINIDHHVSNERFGHFNWVDPHASSAGEMIYRIFKEMDVPLTKETALCLYIAILTDTGSFNYDNTSKVTHEIAGELLGYGLDPASVSESVYEKRSISDIKFLGLVLSTIKVNEAGDVAYLSITRRMLEETGADVSKSEGIVNYAKSIEKIKVAILFREDSKDANSINVSFRSKGDADANRLAAYFGGGGHVKASGCVIRGRLREVEERVLAKVEEVLHGRRAGGR